MKIGSIVIDCRAFDAMVAFWQAALHYIPRAPPRGGWVVLQDPEGRHPNLSLNYAPERHRERNRLHLDLYTPDREAEVQRLLALGATRHPQTYDPADDFRVLADPDGNLFCVVHKDLGAREGPRAEGGTTTPAEADAVPPTR